MSNGYVTNIESLSLDNDNFRQVLFTAHNQQLVVMSLKPTEDIGEEVHEDVDQFIRCEAGSGVAILNGEEHQLKDGFVVVIPAGVKHNIINTSPIEPMKLYTLYSPPHHKDQTIHETKTDAQGDEEHFDGTVTA